MLNNEAIQIFLIRHGEAEKPWHEDPDPGLSVKGQRHAESVCSKFNPNLQLEEMRIMTSPLKRASETAKIFQNHLDIELITSPAFSELPSPGIDLSERPEWLQGIFGQSVSEIDDNLIQWRNQIIENVQNINHHTLIFTHFMVINCIVGWIQGLEKLVNFRPAYCSITHLQRSDNRLNVIQRGIEMNSIIN